MDPNSKERYLWVKRRGILFSVGIAIALFFVCVYSLSVSNFELSFMEAMRIVIDHLTGNVPDRSVDYAAWIRDHVVMDKTAPRTVGSVMAGVILAVGGVIMQTVTRNPLTDPYTIGISSAAMLGYTIALIYGISILPFVGGDAGTMANAFVFALIPSIVIVFVSSFKRISPIMMVLIGIGMMYMFSAFSTFLKFNASDETLQQIYEWSVGTVSSLTWGDIPILTAAAVGVMVVFLFLARNVNILNAGDKVAQSLGVNPVRLRMLSFVVISIVIAVLVCKTGTIGFVGLVAPHIARLVTSNDSKILIPASAVIGAALVVLSDVAVRLIGGLPVGVVTALIGSPLFIYILYVQRKNASF
jgi:ABC-type Fe3+-siderophore transport system permease subunit